MPQTLVERVLSAKVGRPVRPGDVVVVDVDVSFVVDSSSPLAFRAMEEMGLTTVAKPDRTLVIMDHNVPSPRMELSQEQQFTRQAAERYGLRFYDVGSGICHQIVLEEWAVPGEVIIGGDSHTCTHGALCCFATGMGSSDLAAAMGTGQTWLRVPETIEVHLRGKLQPGVSAKDIVLELMRRLGADGATYKALEFTGETVSQLTVSERATLANMAVEMGAKIGIFPSDEQSLAWLAAHGRQDAWRPIAPDPDAVYEMTIEIDCAALEPMIACPHNPENLRPISEVQGTPIHQVFIGTCTNARLEDLAIAAAILKGKRVHPRTRLIVVPSSRTVLKEAVARGYFQDLIDAGAVVGIPSCAACFGMHMGVPGDGENVLSTQNRNFKGRMGNPNASIYLSSPAVAAATALTGEITDPRYL